MKGKGEASWAKVVDGPDRTRRRAGLRGKKGGGLWPRESERFFYFLHKDLGEGTTSNHTHKTRTKSLMHLCYMVYWLL